MTAGIALLSRILARLRGEHLTPLVAPRQSGPRILVLTGAGISAESGLPTYRDRDGLWKRNDPQMMASLAGYKKDPASVRSFHDELARLAGQASPNTGHKALAELQRYWQGTVTVVTTNGDDLHERAGTRNVVHLHGEFSRSLCSLCNVSWPISDKARYEGCPQCGRDDHVRPDVVFFGERPRHLEQVFSLADECDIFLAVGCGGAVSPSNLLPRIAYANNLRDARLGASICQTVEINPIPTGNLSFTKVIKATACEALPEWCNLLLRENAG